MFIQILLRKIIHSIITILTQYLHTKTCRAFVASVIFCLVFNPVYAVEYGMLRYNDSVIDYSQINEQEKRLRADLLFKKATDTKDAKEKQDLLEQASGEYFLLTKIAPQNLYYMVRLARIYDLENKNSFAKGYFFNAS